MYVYVTCCSAKSHRRCPEQGLLRRPLRERKMGGEKRKKRRGSEERGGGEREMVRRRILRLVLILVAVAQRSEIYFEHLPKEIEGLRSVLEKFFRDSVIPSLTTPTFVADVYVDKRLRVWILDLERYGDADPLLFSYSEPPLCGKVSGGRVEVRVMTSEKEARPSFFNFERLPQEKHLVNLTSAQGIEASLRAAKEGKLGGFQ
ncbi:hypothetical protein AAMO2058_000942700 [Amorphochlora amoebiformis]